MPRWQMLAEMNERAVEEEKKLQKTDYPIDSLVLKAHLNECQNVLKGETGLEHLADVVFDRVTSTFDDDIAAAYPADAASGMSPVEQFVRGTSIIDYKDFIDRVNMEFKDKGVVFSQQNFMADEKSTEPVFHLMIKLWAIRHISSIALANGLKIENADNAEFASVRALRTIGYIVDKDSTTPYLFEFPISAKLCGTMDNFMKFSEALQSEKNYLPIKRVSVHTLPPADFPFKTTKEISELHFQIVCSAFFAVPQIENAGDIKTTEVSKAE